MRLGIHTAQYGPLADPAAVRAVALAAEQVGYDALWVLDRLPAALEPRNGYGDLDGVDLPEEQQRALDPLAVLAASAAVTTRVRLGTSVLVGPWYRPALLARSLTSLDILSSGRLTVGLGMGWSVDEFEAVGVDKRARGTRLDELLDVLDAHWSDGPIAYDGPTGRMAPAANELRPVQRPRPPLVLAAYSDAGLDRVARRADGWQPASLGADQIEPAWNRVRDLAAGYGRDPDQLELIVKANVLLTDVAMDGERLPFWGSVEQVADDIDAVRGLGAHEVILGLGGPLSLDETLDGYARLAEAVGVRAGRAQVSG